MSANKIMERLAVPVLNTSNIFCFNTNCAYSNIKQPPNNRRVPTTHSTGALNCEKTASAKAPFIPHSEAPVAAKATPFDFPCNFVSSTPPNFVLIRIIFCYFHKNSKSNVIPLNLLLQFTTNYPIILKA